MPSILWSRCRLADLEGLLDPGLSLRQQQRQGARLLAAWLMGRLLGRKVSPQDIVRLDDGAPSHPEAFVSLSHSGPWLAAAVALAPVGIDIEQPKAKRPLGEMAALLGWPEEGFYGNWCAYEAAVKAWGAELLPGELQWGRGELRHQSLGQLQLYRLRSPLPLAIVCTGKMRPRWQNPMLMKAEYLLH
ncbi:hypothetical protein PVT67_09860 [Gallaecimonas kandeliae]|uniref:hypothetical protein n=1 Tax=Gallaecimonas kandeliae TaxID=3029055 RepID=UPI002648FBE7|nr:hypothetical protein [Gallaecimonas kandeliae]WKE64004.1 hypothetical protein PVT67_09860 [Gallaecimonas kandeliae]